ncbi:MAG: Gfo/Idh/MocA family protein [Solirubrobacterales bacterium]
MIKLAVVGLGKMGVSHLAIVNAHPEVEVAAVCDSSSYVLGVLKKYTGMPTYGNYEAMLRDVDLDAVLIATPSRTHTDMVRSALERDLHVFCEKPLTLSARDAEHLADLARRRGVVTQVGYHNRFVGSFREVKTLLDAGAIGAVSNVLGEAYGPVVLKRKGGTWRSRKEEGGGSLYDYAAHPINLLNWYLGEPIGVGATVLNSIFSREIDDEVFSTLFYADGSSARVAVNWSDESYRKMTTRITAWGAAGRIYADRQECRVYLRGTAPIPSGYQRGWNLRYATELTESVGFYLRGEEYSAQIDHFVERVKTGRVTGLNGFESAAATDSVIAMMLTDARKGASTRIDEEATEPDRKRSRRFLPGRRLQPAHVLGRVETRG